MVPLAQLEVTKSVFVIKEIVGSDANRLRLHSLGFIPGSEVSILAKLPFQGPVAFIIRGTKIALRRQDADAILVEQVV